MIIKIVKLTLPGSDEVKGSIGSTVTQYKETHHQLYIYPHKEYLKAYPHKADQNVAENSNNEVKPEAVIVYNYKDGGGGHLHVFKGTDIYLMNNDGKTVDRYFYH